MKTIYAFAAYDCMTKRDDVFVFSGHGAPGQIAFFNFEGICTGAISAGQGIKPSASTATDIKYISDIEANGLSHARAIIYLGCETGADRSEGSVNLVDRTFNKGAHFVLGVKVVVYASHHNEWLDYFLDAINSGMNIEDSVEYARNTLNLITVEGITYTKIPLYTRGDSSQYLAIT